MCMVYKVKKSISKMIVNGEAENRNTTIRVDTIIAIALFMEAVVIIIILMGLPETETLILNTVLP